jgi:hypothetical protein
MGVALPMLAGSSLSRWQNDVLWGGLLGAVVKLSGASDGMQYGGVVVGALASEYNQGTL